MSTIAESEDVAGLVAALAGLDPAPTLAEVAAALGSPVAAFLGAVESATAEGLVEPWETDDGPRLLLSGLALARLGLELEDVSPRGWRWRPVGAPRRPDRSRAAECDDARAAVRISGPPPAADPVELAIRSEDAERRGELPPPRHLLGSTEPWSGPHRGTCPTCEDRPLGPRTLCLRCLKWSDDHRLKLAKVSTRRVMPEAGTLAGGKGTKAGPKSRKRAPAAAVA